MTKSYFRQDVGNVRLVERREGEAFLAKMIQRRAYMYQGSFVYDEKTVMELVGHLYRERIAVLRIEQRDIDAVKQFAPRVLHHKYQNALPLLRNERQHGVVEVLCSVKTLGRYFMLWPRPLFKVAICDLERLISSAVLMRTF